MSVKMQTLWQRIEAQIARHEPTRCVTAPRVASDEEISKVEGLLGVKLPDELRTFYQKFSHDWAWRLGRWVIQPLPDLGFLTDSMTETTISDYVVVDNDQYWNPKWIDFAEDLDGKRFMCLNLDTETLDTETEFKATDTENPFTQVGEVFEYDLEEGYILSQGVGFRDWLENLLTELESQEKSYGVRSRE